MAAAAVSEIQAARLDSMKRGFEDRIRSPPRKARLLLGKRGLDLLSAQHERNEDGFATAFLVGGQVGQSIAAVDHLFDCEEQEVILTDELKRSSRRRSRSPRPLKVEAAKMSGHIDNFSDEVETRHFAALHCLRGKFVGVDPSGGHLGLFESLRARWTKAPTVNLLLEVGESGIRPAGGRVVFQPAVGKPGREDLPQF